MFNNSALFGTSLPLGKTAPKVRGCRTCYFISESFNSEYEFSRLSNFLGNSALSLAYDLKIQFLIEKFKNLNI